MEGVHEPKFWLTTSLDFQGHRVDAILINLKGPEGPFLLIV